MAHRVFVPDVETKLEDMSFPPKLVFTNKKQLRYAISEGVSDVYLSGDTGESDDQRADEDLTTLMDSVDKLKAAIQKELDLRSPSTEETLELEKSI